MDFISSYFLFFSLLASVSKAHGHVRHDCVCGTGNRGISDRIVGGYPVLPHSYPWLAEITMNKSLHCGGSIINDRYILTAGHCVKWVDKKDLQIVLGRHDRRQHSGVTMSVDKIMLQNGFWSHQEYDENDIALMRTKEPIRFTRNVSPICLPHPMSRFGGQNAFVIGWGRIYPNKKITSQVVLRGDLKIMHDHQCNKSMIGFGYKTGNLCAYKDFIDACQGDSGSPLIYESRKGSFQIIGVVSWGLDCATPNAPGVYARVPRFIDWITENTRDGNYCKLPQ